MSQVSPSDEDLLPIVELLRKQNPTLGIPKFHTLLLNEKTEWTVSEKRVRRLLTQLGLGAQTQTSGTGGMDQGHVYPTSQINQSLRLEQWTAKVKVHYFDKKKGKGLVATEVIEEGEEIWKEDPFVIAPEWHIWDAQGVSISCAYCTTTLSNRTALQKACERNGAGCTARFCSTLCRTRAQNVHPLLCVAQNPAVGPLFAWIRETEWMAPHALAHCIARVILAHEKGLESDVLKESRAFLGSLAEMSLEQRAKDIKATPNHELWKVAFKHFLDAFRVPIESKKLSRIVKKPISASLVPELYDYNAFITGIGRMSLNLEAHGGLYVLHSHLNHSCDPNVSIRHLHQRTHLSRITAIAKSRIEPGQELTITYVDPSQGVAARRRGLREWNWGECDCERCRREEKEVGRAPEASAESARPGLDINDLENELRDGLGLV